MVYQKKYTEYNDYLEHMRNCMIGVNNPFYRKKHSTKTKKLMSKNMRGILRSAETKKKISFSKMGEKNPNWEGGISFIYFYDFRFNNNFKNTIKNRDNWKCFLCCSSKKLCIHHIDYNKKNTVEKNCITLCDTCHKKTNFNRNNWHIYFQKYLTEKFKYEYLKGGKDLIIINN